MPFKQNEHMVQKLEQQDPRTGFKQYPLQLLLDTKIVLVLWQLQYYADRYRDRSH